MREFFHGWRRKMGAATLVIACVLMMLWVRSYLICDWFLERSNDGNSAFLASGSGSFAASGPSRWEMPNRFTGDPGEFDGEKGTIWGHTRCIWDEPERRAKFVGWERMNACSAGAKLQMPLETRVASGERAVESEVPNDGPPLGAREGLSSLSSGNLLASRSLASLVSRSRAGRFYASPLSFGSSPICSAML